MNTALQNTLSVEDIKSQFPFASLDRIVGKPN